MSSSTSDSDRRFVGIALTAFLGAFVALLLPYEMMVRASEHRYGIRRANICMPRSLTPKLDSLLADVLNGVRYDAYIVGTSRVEASLRPDILDASVGRTYNAGFGGVSSIATMELLDRLAIHPSRLIVGVSPMDFTPLGIRRGRNGIIRADAFLNKGTMEESGPAAWSRAIVRACIHGSSGERRRNLGQWLELVRDRGNVLAFLNNEDATGPIIGAPTRGYSASDRVASAEQIVQGEWGNIPDEYRSGRATLFPRMAALIQRYRQRGTTVILVRVPSTIGVRRAEDADTSVDADLRALSRACGVSYIDGFALMGSEFAADRRNFSDGEHMNANGALRFSRALAAALTAPGSGQGRQAAITAQ